MTEKEYIKKRDSIATSEASPDVKAAAMAKLTDLYIDIRVKAMAQIIESAPDPITAAD